MSENNLKTHYSAKELSTLSLSSLPNSVQGIIYQAKKQSWESRKRTGKGGGVEYCFASLPQVIQVEILLKQAKIDLRFSSTLTLHGSTTYILNYVSSLFSNL